MQSRRSPTLPRKRAGQAWQVAGGKGAPSHRGSSTQGPWGVALSVCQRNSGVNKWMSG